MYICFLNKFSSFLTTNNVEGNSGDVRAHIKSHPSAAVRLQFFHENISMFRKYFAEAIQNNEVEGRREDFSMLKPTLTCRDTKCPYMKICIQTRNDNNELYTTEVINLPRACNRPSPNHGLEKL